MGFVTTKKMLYV